MNPETPPGRNIIPGSFQVALPGTDPNGADLRELFSSSSENQLREDPLVPFGVYRLGSGFTRSEPTLDRVKRMSSE